MSDTFNPPRRESIRSWSYRPNRVGASCCRLVMRECFAETADLVSTSAFPWGVVVLPVVLRRRLVETQPYTYAVSGYALEPTNEFAELLAVMAAHCPS